MLFYYHILVGQNSYWFVELVYCKLPSAKIVCNLSVRLLCNPLKLQSSSSNYHVQNQCRQFLLLIYTVRFYVKIYTVRFCVADHGNLLCKQPYNRHQDAKVKMEQGHLLRQVFPSKAISTFHIIQEVFLHFVYIMLTAIKTNAICVLCHC